MLAAAQLTETERRQLEPLCRSRPCFKWSRRQRAGYTTPRHYGPEDVAGVQATMSGEPSPYGVISVTLPANITAFTLCEVGVPFCSES